MSDLYRLVYTSFRKSNCTDEEIENILASCKKNNPGRDVTGVLIHSENRFIQYMEGPKERVEELYTLKQTDPRHTSVNKRNFEPIKERVFPSWEMGYKNVSGNGVTLQSDVSESDKKSFDKTLNGEIDFNDHGMRLLNMFFK